MRIDASSRLQTSAYRAEASRASGAGFVLAEEPPMLAATASASAFAPTTALDMLLALQAVEDPRLTKRKQVRRGRSLLQALDDVRVDLLTGELSPERLTRLLAVLGQAREHTEPGLDAVIDDIELRVRVELAKFGR